MTSPRSWAGRATGSIVTRSTRKAKTLKLWVRRKRGNRVLRCPSCGRRVEDIHEIYERAVRDLPCFEYQTTVIIELYRIRCPDCGVKAEKVAPLPSEAPYTASARARTDPPVLSKNDPGWR